MMSKRRFDPEQIAMKIQQSEIFLVHGINQSLVLISILTISFILFLLISIEWFNINDFAYGVAAAVWAKHGSLYTDVPFIQAPFSIMMNLGISKIIGSVDIFLLQRITSIVLVLGAVLMPLLGASKRQNSSSLALYIAMCVTNPYIHSNSREIGNYALPLLCLSLSVAIINMRGSHALCRGFFACAAIGLAASTKLYFIIMCPAILLYFLIYERNSFRPKIIAGCIAGFLLGTAPILYFLILDHQSFLNWNVEFYIHVLKVREETMLDGAASLGQLLKASIDFVFQMAIPIGFTIARMVEEYRCGGARGPLGRLTLLAAAYIMAILPFFVSEQYLAPLALLLFQFSMPRRSSSETLQSRYVIFSVVLFCTQAGILIEHGVRQYFKSGGLDVVQVIRLQKRASEIVGDGYKCDRKFYSAEPLFLLDDRVQYPRELASGPFILFVGRRALNEIGNDFDIKTSIVRWNPDVVIWGYFLESAPAADEVDRIVRDYAIEQRFQIVPLGPFQRRDMYLAYRQGCAP